MKDFWNNAWSKEPAAIIGVLMAIATIATVFIPHLSAPQIAAINGLAIAIGTAVTRSQVDPTSGATKPSIDLSKRGGMILLACAIGLGAVTTAGCGPLKANLTAPATLSADAKAAFYKTRVIKTVDLARDAAVDANTTIAADGTPLLSTTSTRKVVTWHRSVLLTIKASDAGWQAGLTTGVDELLADLPQSDKTLIAPYAALLKTILQEVN